MSEDSRRSRKQYARPGVSGCLSPEQLELLAAGEIAPELRTERDLHLRSCATCRDALTALGDNRDLFAGLRQAVREAAATETTDRPEPLAPGVIDGYTLQSELHRGSRAAVYSAIENGSGRPVAIKILLGEPWTGARDRERFRREIELAASLDHPHIVPVRDSGCGHGLCWMVTPLVSGRHLDVWVREMSLDRRGRLVLFARICRAIDHAHRRGVIHRDLKPANILIDDEGEPQILDFGLAKSVQATSGAAPVTLTGQFVGTPAYASPEQVRREGASITTGTDVYSLGVVLYEQITGSLPYDVDGSLADVTQRICDAEPADPRAQGGRIDYALRAILLRALEKEPARRQASAGELAADLERYLAGESIAVTGAPRWYLLRRWLRRQRRALMVQALILVLLGTSLVVYLDLHFRAESQRTTAEQIQSVLRDVLAAARPDRMGGGVELVDVLEQASQRIDDTLRDAPDVRAAVQLSLGETYHSLLMMAEAQPHLEAALERFRAVNAEPLVVARTLHLLGQVLRYRSSPRAVSCHREALTIRERFLGHDDPLVAQSQRDLAVALIRAPIDRDLAVARRLLDVAHANFVRIHGEQHAEVARTLHGLADLHRNQGERDRAESRLREAAATYELPAQDANPWAVECFYDLALLLQDRRRFDEAETWLQHGAALTEKLFGDHRATDVLRRFARLSFGRGEYEQAEQYSVHAVQRELDAVARRKPGEASRLRALIPRLALGFGTRDGQNALVESFRVFRDERGRGSYEISEWLNGLSSLAQARRQPDLVVALLREAVNFHCRIFGEDCPVRLESLKRLGAALHACGDHAQASDQLRVALGIALRTHRDDDAGAIRALLLECEGALPEKTR